ncbi:MAG: hypothetical protein M3O07_05775 [Pseudomonadota bacterium]|nr:hypothetical protein [Pseudomonadota bacterium]
MRKWIKRIAAALEILIAAALAVLVIAMSYESSCGPPDMLAIENVERPVPAANEMLVKVREAGFVTIE